MIELATLHCGTVRFSEDDVLTFPGGLPGFWHATRFLLLAHPTNRAIRYLQSADIPGLRFILVAALTIMPDYEISIEPWDLEHLLVAGSPQRANSPSEHKLESWFILSTPQPDRLTLNMLAPVVISHGSKRGVQAVRSDTRYSHAFLLDGHALEAARRPVC